MLMKVVLPAPLVPMSPTTESFSMAALTSFAAVTAPKDLHNPRASRMAGIPLWTHFPCQGPEAFGEEHDDDEQRQPEAHLPGIRRKIVRRGMDRAVDQGAGEGSHHASRAGEDGDEDEFARRGPVG